MTDAQTEARAIVSAALPPHEQAMLGGDAVVVLSDLIATALAAKDAELARRDMQLEASAKVALDLSAQLAEARKALEPFAKASGLDGHQRDNEPLSGYWADIDNEGSNAITFGHLRAARRVLEQGGE